MLAENLKKFRKLCGFRQEDVAKIIGVDRSAYAYYEGGKTEPNVENIKKIAALFRVDVNTLVGAESSASDVAPRFMELRNDNHFTYENNMSTEETIGKCSREEKLLIAYYRVCKNKEKVMETVRSLYEESIMDIEE